MSWFGSFHFHSYTVARHARSVVHTRALLVRASVSRRCEGSHLLSYLVEGKRLRVLVVYGREKNQSKKINTLIQIRLKYIA